MTVTIRKLCLCLIIGRQISGADENLLLLVGFKTTALIIFLLPYCIPIVTYDLTRLSAYAARFA